MEKIVLLGAGGHGRDVLDAALMQGRCVIGFLDEDKAIHHVTINGIPVLGGPDWLLENRLAKVIISVGNPRAKKRLAEFLNAHGLEIAQPVIHPNAYVSTFANIGKGTVILSGTSIQPQAKVGEHVYVSTVSTLGHDVIVEDYSSLHPGVQVGGESIVGCGSFIGMGVKILPRLKIGAWSTIGAGSVVIKDVKENATVVGVPAKVIKENNERND